MVSLKQQEDKLTFYVIKNKTRKPNSIEFPSSYQKTFLLFRNLIFEMRNP